MERKQMRKRKPLYFLATAACAVVLGGVLRCFVYGIPLLGIPQAEALVSVEMTSSAYGETKMTAVSEEIELVRNATGLLRHTFSEAEWEEPDVTVVFTDRNGKRYELSASENCVTYGLKTYKLKQEGLFVNIVEGLCFGAD